MRPLHTLRDQVAGQRDERWNKGEIHTPKSGVGAQVPDNDTNRKKEPYRADVVVVGCHNAAVPDQNGNDDVIRKSTKNSLGVLMPSQACGRLLLSASMGLRSAWEIVRKSVPLEKHFRIKPPVFLLVTR